MIEHFLCPTEERLQQLRCDSPFCYAGVNMIVFTPDGMMHACSPAVPLSLVGEDFSLGDINGLKINHFENSLERFHEKGDKYINQCSNCEAAKICDFGCPAFDRIDPVTAENHCIATKGLLEVFKNMTKEELNLCITPSHKT